MVTLVIDHYDSFTWNLVDLIATVNGETPIVVQHDQISWEEIRDLELDNIVLSPGPGTPLRPEDFAVSRQVLANSRLPILGVCLGHQGVAAHFGGRIYQTSDPRHGRSSLIQHDGAEIFKGLPNPLEVIRYHSLAVAEPLPDELAVTARLLTAEGAAEGEPAASPMIMALRHRHRPIWGVQFHPESILSQGGAQLLANFRDISREQGRRHPHRRAQTPGFTQPPPEPAPEPAPAPAPATRRAIWQKHDWLVEGEAAFLALFADAPTSFWLDSGLSDQGRWSFLGAATTLHRFDSSAAVFAELTELLSGGIANPPPIPFCGGLVGWLGYEAAADPARLPKGPSEPASQPLSEPASQSLSEPASQSLSEPACQSLPDCGMMLAERFIAIDHRGGSCTVVALLEGDPPDPSQELQARQWLSAVADTLCDMPQPDPPAPRLATREPTQPTQPTQFRLSHSRRDYCRAVQQALDWIAAGEAYQLCLTTKITTDDPGLDPLTLYRILRRRNPAPHAAYLRFEGGAILSSSPERFLSASRSGRLEAKPIKGTARRDPEPSRDQQIAFALAASEKDRAENLMIVDLLRNDLSQIAETGSVAVPSLIAVESFATVHQLVSTITAQLRPGVAPLAAVAAAFPGGSMTGAPKKRAMELLSEIEHGKRGVYSGALGWFGFDGAFDLAIVIRTILVAGGKLSLGVGGGIVAQSTPDGEFQEMLLKARALIAAIEWSINGTVSASPTIIGAEE